MISVIHEGGFYTKIFFLPTNARQGRLMQDHIGVISSICISSHSYAELALTAYVTYMKKSTRRSREVRLYVEHAIQSYDVQLREVA